jgi:hypothetical protein
MTRLRSTEFDSIEAMSWVSSLKTEEEEKEELVSASMQRFI